MMILTGGPYGVGHRMPLDHTRTMVRAILAGRLDPVPMQTDAVFGIEVPTAIAGVPEDILVPRATWNDPAAYDTQAAKLARMFEENFAAYADRVSDEVRAAGPTR